MTQRPQYFRTHQLLTQTALELSQSHHWQRVTVTNIVKQAKVNRNTFYLHFENIDALFNEYEQQIVNQYQALLNQYSLYEMVHSDEFNKKFDHFFNLHQPQVLLIDQIGRTVFFMNKMRKAYSTIIADNLIKVIPNSTERFAVMQYLTGGVEILFSSWVANQTSTARHTYIQQSHRIFDLLLGDYPHWHV